EQSCRVVGRVREERAHAVARSGRADHSVPRDRAVPQPYVRHVPGLREPPAEEGATPGGKAAGVVRGDLGQPRPRLAHHTRGRLRVRRRGRAGTRGLARVPHGPVRGDETRAPVGRLLLRYGVQPDGPRPRVRNGGTPGGEAETAAPQPGPYQ